MAGLLQLLFGGAAAPAAAPHKWGTDPDGYLVPQAVAPAPPPNDPNRTPAPGALVNQVAQASPASSLVQAATNPEAADNRTPITVSAPTGDTWKPHKAGILGQIADYLLDTHFGKENERRNMEGAMEHLTSNPMEAVRRMAKFNPQAAQELYDKVIDNQRMQGTLDRQNRATDIMADKYLDGYVANMMYAASQSNDPGMYEAARQRAIQMGGRYGRDYNDLPTEMNPEYTKAYGMGAIPAARQMAVGEQVRNHDIQHGDRVEGHSIQRERNQIMREQGNARIGVSQGNLDERREHDDVIEGQGQERINQNKPGTPTMTKYGPGTISPDGNTLTINNPVHGALQYIKVNGEWHLSKTKPNKGHDITVNQ